MGTVLNLEPRTEPRAPEPNPAPGTRNPGTAV